MSKKMSSVSNLVMSSVIFSLTTSLGALARYISPRKAFRPLQTKATEGFKGKRTSRFCSMSPMRCSAQFCTKM